MLAIFVFLLNLVSRQLRWGAEIKFNLEKHAQGMIKEKIQTAIVWALVIAHNRQGHPINKPDIVYFIIIRYEDSTAFCGRWASRLRMSERVFIFTLIFFNC